MRGGDLTQFNAGAECRDLARVEAARVAAPRIGEARASLRPSRARPGRGCQQFAREKVQTKPRELTRGACRGLFTGAQWSPRWRALPSGRPRPAPQLASRQDPLDCENEVLRRARLDKVKIEKRVAPAWLGGAIRKGDDARRGTAGPN